MKISKNARLVLSAAATISIAAGLTYDSGVVAEESSPRTVRTTRQMIVSPDAIELPSPSRTPSQVSALTQQMAQASALDKTITPSSPAQSVAITSASERVRIFSHAAANLPQPAKPVEPASARVSAPAAAAPTAPAVEQPAVSAPVIAQPSRPDPQPQAQDPNQYRVGVDDVMDIGILQPEQFLTTVTVTPDGYITFPYVGTLSVKGLTLAQVQELIVEKLSDGYMRYPVITVALKESRSRKFFVYGEVSKPGGYPMESQMTVLRAISTAGGFTKFGNTSRVKVLRPNVGAPGYEGINVNIKAVMSGNSTEDLLLAPGDMVVVSEGMF
jgi:polysaccharide export outer membrane protein